MSDYHTLADSLLGMKDWHRVVASTKDLIVNGEENPGEALGRLYSFLDPMEIKRAVEQAQEELGEE